MKKGMIILAAAAVVLLIAGLTCTATVQTGYTGIVTTFGRVEDVTLEAGLHFKKGLGWKACFDEERGIYTAERSWRGFYQLCEIDKETYDKLDPTGKNGEDPDKLIGGGRVLVEADDDYYTMPYCMVKDENYNELAPWSRAKERYERTYNEDKGNGS